MSGTDAPPPDSLPATPPLSLTIEGILDGRAADRHALKQAVDALSGCGAGRFRVDFAGGRFSIIPEAPAVAPDAFDLAAHRTFLEQLQQVVDTAELGSVETNLRCQMIYAEEVAETLFAVRNGVVEPLTRRRARNPGDLPSLPPAVPTASGAFGIDRRQLLWIAPASLLAGSLVAWQAGWLDRVLAARAETLHHDAGPFGTMLAVTTSRSWGVYSVEVARGEDYPATPDALAQRLDSATGLDDRAAAEIVGNGGEFFVQLLNAEGTVIAQSRAELRSLLTTAEERVKVSLPGKMNADRVRLSLSRAKSK